MCRDPIDTLPERINSEHWMGKMHTHEFVENYKGLVGFGAGRETDENTIIYYLQKFSDDKFMATIIKRMTDKEMQEIFDLINRLLKKHLTEAEYHGLFLKDHNGV